jgi:hypothetical protein
MSIPYYELKGDIPESAIARYSVLQNVASGISVHTRVKTIIKRVEKVSLSLICLGIC